MQIRSRPTTGDRSAGEHYRSPHRRPGQQKYLDQQCKTGWPHSLLDICGREKLMHIISLNFSRHTDRARVAERAIFATPNALNLQRAKKSNPLRRNIHAVPPKLWGHPNTTSAENRLILEASALLKSTVERTPNSKLTTYPFRDFVPFPRFRSLALFERRPHRHVQGLSSPASEKLYINGLTHCNMIGL